MNRIEAFTSTLSDDHLISALGKGGDNIYLRELVKRYNRLKGAAPPDVVRKAQRVGLYVDIPPERVDHLSLMKQDIERKASIIA